MIVTRQQHRPAQRQEGDGGVERHGDVAGDDVKGLDAIRIADESGERDDARGQHQRLTRSTRGRLAKLQNRQSGAEQDKNQGAVGIDIALADARGKQQVVDSKIGIRHVGDHPNAADQKDDGRADAAGPLLP